MAKKDLGDLLREEVQKNSSADINLGEQMSQEDNSIAETEAADDTNNHRAKRALTKADLEALVNDLRAALEESQKYSNSLEQKVADLQSDLQTQKASVQKLKAELKEAEQNSSEIKTLRSEVGKIDKIKAELEDAKNFILQLSETNTKSSKKPATPSKQSQQIVPSKSNEVLTTPTDKVIHSHLPSTTLTNSDIGWVD
ncbi:hypothetical protein [Aliterella atlantica]|uniref:Uncharacterized protein n=1 Tax=Aliterella atlantica CENA595 TaxID=1618023 RepID=A0A0D8ZWL7_9CYAN|nr:hypothetical protein [Aliterella atlantica]KJH72824.1 hypothetical protein UH38_04520 [Aliterella atlantica CENA595]